VLFVVVGAVVFVFRGQVNAYIGAPVAELLVLMLAVQLFYDFVVAVLEGLNKVHLASLLDPIWWVGRAVVQISLVALGVGVVGLFYGYIAAGAVAVAVGAYLASIGWERPSRSHVEDLVSYARYSWLRPIKGRTFMSMDTIVLGFFVTNSLIGIYEIAWNLASLFAIFGTSISKTLFPEISSSASRDDTDEVRRMVTAALSYAGLFLIPGLVGAALLGETILGIYGEEFSTGYQILLVLTFARLVQSFEGQLSNSLDAIDHAEETFRINAVFIVTNMTLNVLFVWQYGWIGAAVATTLASGLGVLLSYRSLSKYVEVNVPVTELLRQVVAAALMGGIVYAGKNAFGSSLPVALVLVAVGASVYFGTLLVISPQFKRTIRANVPARFQSYL
jgi:O-antigen/teichoic acid export membrane protein